MGISNRLRIELWKICWVAFKKHPWLGWGPSNFILAFRNSRGPQWIKLAGDTLDHTSAQSEAHNDILEIAVTMGLVGLAAYLNLQYQAFRRAHGVVLAVLVAACVQAKVNPIPLPALAILALTMGAM